MIGKVTPSDLEALVFDRTGAPDEDVLQGPAYGEDTAAVRIGDQILVINTDPISLAVERIGSLGVNVACNDVAASGARPRWLSTVIFLPGENDEMLDRITAQIDEAAAAVGVAVVGGHSEYAPELDQPLLSLTCLGLTDRYVSSGGAQPGDAVVLTKGAGIEGTAVLATDFRDDLQGCVDEATITTGAGFFSDVSVIPEATILGPRATAMHDPTEGGLIDGLLEMAVASGVVLDVTRSEIPIRDATAAITAAMDVDPLRIFGSGALVATIPEPAVETALADLAEADIEAAVIGTVRGLANGETPGIRIDGDAITTPVRDDLYRFWE